MGTFSVSARNAPPSARRRSIAGCRARPPARGAVSWVGLAVLVLAAVVAEGGEATSAWPEWALAPEPSPPAAAPGLGGGPSLILVGHDATAPPLPGQSIADRDPLFAPQDHGHPVPDPSWYDPPAGTVPEAHGHRPGGHRLGGGLLGRGPLGPQPFGGESWLQRPVYLGAFVGYMQGSELVDDWVGQQGGAFSGIRFGWDFHERFGARSQLGFASLPLYDSGRAIAARERLDDEAELDPLDPERIRHGIRRHGDMTLGDLSLLYYPRGDTLVRPYLLVGLGVSANRFHDRVGDRWQRTNLAMPLALGLTTRYSERIALRIECADNITFGGGRIQTMHNLSVTAAAEFRWGSTRRVYYPWNPGRHYW